MAAARAVGDRRLAAYTGIAYATLPLVYMNARQMLGGSVAQSATTLGLSGLALVLWGRDRRWQIGGALAAVAGLVLGFEGGGALVGVVPVLGAAGLAVALRFGREGSVARAVGMVSLAVGTVLAIVALKVASHPVTAYSPWVGAAGGSPAQWQTFEAYIEQLGHGTFPWTGFALFGIMRLVSPPSQSADGTPDPTLDLDEAAALDGWREGGFRLMAFVAFALGFAAQTFHMQLFGMTPFALVAPLALGIGVLLRDCERERVPWRTVAVGAGLFTLLMLRDYLQFPRSSYAALGLPDGGPTFPTGFQAKPGEWLSAVSAARREHGEVPPMPAEMYFVIETLVFLALGVLVVFQGAGEQRVFAVDRPYRWTVDIEQEYQAMGLRETAEDGRRNVGTVLLSHLRVLIVVLAVVALVVGLSVPGYASLTTPAVSGLHLLAVSPALVVLGILALLGIWDLYAALGRPGSAVQKTLGSRVVLVPVAATLVALIVTQGYMPALSEHMSPRGVWAVVRALRHGNERVGRYGGPADDPATRYYTSVQPETVGTEDAAVEFLTGAQRSFLVVGADVFPALNRAYRRVRHANVPVADASNSNLLVAVSDLEGRPERNPLAPWVLTEAPHVRHPVREPARLEDQMEYIGYDLDSNGQPFVPLGGSFKVTFNFHVLREPSRNWQIFVHTDGAGPRINGDHEPVSGRYPVRDWLPGDYIRDQITIQIPLTYRPGVYTVYIGFFDGADRMRVEGGEHDRENRVIAARVNVR